MVRHAKPGHECAATFGLKIGHYVSVPYTVKLYANVALRCSLALIIISNDYICTIDPLRLLAGGTVLSGTFNPPFVKLISRI